MRKISDHTKIREGRGTGTGKYYKPYIKAREFNSLGTCSNFVDWKTGRAVELFSQTELAAYCTLRWNDDVIDINEQYPLDNKLISTILVNKNNQLKREGQDTMKSPIIHEAPMTTDLLVMLKNKSKIAYSVKYSKQDLSKRDIEKLWLEKNYWNKKGVVWKLIDRSDLNMTLVKNIMLVTEFYDVNRVFDDISLIKHAIAHKEVLVNITDEILDFSNVQYYLKLIEGEKSNGDY